MPVKDASPSKNSAAKKASAVKKVSARKADAGRPSPASWRLQLLLGAKKVPAKKSPDPATKMDKAINRLSRVNRSGEKKATAANTIV